MVVFVASVDGAVVYISRGHNGSLTDASRDDGLIPFCRFSQDLVYLLSQAFIRRQDLAELLPKRRLSVCVSRRSSSVMDRLKRRWAPFDG
jgi:hypothetical protein